VDDAASDGCDARARVNGVVCVSVLTPNAPRLSLPFVLSKPSMRWLTLVAWAAATAVAARAEGLHPAHALVWTSEAYGAPPGVQHAGDDKGRVAYQAVHTGQLAASLANLLHSGAHDSGGACTFPAKGT
jgi:hypothetical protein